MDVGASEDNVKPFADACCIDASLQANIPDDDADNRGFTHATAWVAGVPCCDW